MMVLTATSSATIVASPPLTSPASSRVPDSCKLPSHVSSSKFGRFSGNRTLGYERCFAAGKTSGSRVSEESTFQSPLPLRDFYELLGVTVQASSGEIRQAYRNLQKKYHPDIAGIEGHAMTLLLNEAYRTLMDDDLRAAYNKAHSYAQTMKSARYSAFTGVPYSTWVGPDRPQGIFVDENVCIGCRECAYVAPNTFKMDESTGCARVKAQWADRDSSVNMARELCPVNCIHLVEREDLAALEYLIQPQLKASNGIYGGGWVRTRNVFMAAATLKRQAAEEAKSATSSVKEETPAQRKARMEADLQIRMGPFWKVWSWMGGGSSRREDFGQKPEGPTEGWPWKGLFGRSSSSNVLVLPLSQETSHLTVRLVQEWASTFASSSELPLPMPFRADPLPNGVQLSLITASDGMVSSIGSLIVTVERPSELSGANANDSVPEEVEKKGWDCYLRVRREGTTGNGALPGERRILKILKNVVLGRDVDYGAYQLPRL